MSRVDGKLFIAEPEAKDTCEYCGKVAELRPYGRNGARICFPCGMKNKEETGKMFMEAIKDVDTVVRNDREITVLVLPNLRGQS